MFYFVWLNVAYMFRPSQETQLWLEGESILGPLFEHVIQSLWKLLKLGSTPVSQLLAFLLWSGLSMAKLIAFIYRLCRRFVKWLNAKCELPWLWGGNSIVSRRSYILVASLLAVSALTTLLHQIRRQWSVYFRTRNSIVQRMHDSKTKKEWTEHAGELRSWDWKHGKHKTKAAEDRLYNVPLIQKKTRHLKEFFRNGKANVDVGEMVRSLREDMVRKLANIQDTTIYDYHGHIPKPIEMYLGEMQRCVEYVSQTDRLSDFDKLDFINKTRRAFGRTALLLSGGGSLGAYHLGVAKALVENDLLPTIVCGSSAGSIVASVLGCYTIAELNEWVRHMEDIDLQFFSSSSVRQFIGSLLMKGHIHDADYFCIKLEELLGDLTFLEAYHKSGRVLNVVVSSANADEPPRVLNYLTAPQVLVWSAVAASSAFPGLFPPQNICSRTAEGNRVCFGMPDCTDMERRWRDGTLEEDLPIQPLREMFSVNYFIVSQTNPHIVPLLNLRSKLNKRIATAMEHEWKLRCRQLESLLPDWMPKNWLRLFSQTWEGDVTMVLPLSNYGTLLKVMFNPTTEEMLNAVHLGEVCTWEKLAAIESNCAIEKALDKALSAVLATIASKNETTNHRPRALAPAMGIPNVHSLESLLAFERKPVSHLSLEPTTYRPLFDTNPAIDCVDPSAAQLHDSSSDSLKHTPSGDALNCIAP